MKKGFEKALILSLSIAIVLLTAAGCQKQTTTTQKGTVQATDKAGKQVVIKTAARKTSKTTIAEIVELQKELAGKNMEIEAIKAELDKCEAENAAAKKEGDSMGEEAMKTFDENIKLLEENKNLQKQIEELKAAGKPKAEISG